MAPPRNLLGFMVLILSLSICNATIFHPISDTHRFAAQQLFKPIDGSFGSLEETYEALRIFQVLNVGKNVDISSTTCPLVKKILGSSDSSPKDFFYALKVNSILKCEIDADTFEGITSKLQTIVKDAELLLDFYHSIGSLVLIKNQGSKGEIVLGDADGTFHSIKALSQSDGKWRYSFNGAESSTYAAGLALESLAGVVSLASSEIDQSMIGTVKNDIMKLFDSLQKYDDGAQYFDEKSADTREHQGPLSTTSSVVHGITAFSAVTSGTLNVPGDKILGLAKFFLGIGVPGNANDLFSQIDSLACLENNKISVPLIISLPATVLSLTKNDKLKVNVNTVLGSEAPPLTVKLVQAVSSSSKGTPVVENQELEFDTESSAHYLDISAKGFDVGKYTFVFRVLLRDPEHKNIYSTGGQTQVPIFVTGLVKVDGAEIAVLESDLVSVEIKKK
ncbi:hypothetical protein GIB67_001257 [Kingdonia uniflora]|uniref:Dolichyl-diphosphooligosaccharide--protein glycosyltransferase subunit 2 n=1 Tax=Kingdonia uniflora TaxID=39325 RepID=A0A7J7LHP7_9MAGN|nr:hypothetical protein GIB67_001257 [Kingdonia uniflora]